MRSQPLNLLSYQNCVSDCDGQLQHAHPRQNFAAPVLSSSCYVAPLLPLESASTRSWPSTLRSGESFFVFTVHCDGSPSVTLKSQACNKKVIGKKKV